MDTFYAGIGSRQTPENVLELMRQIAVQYAGAGWTLRSGGAYGADRAFEQGCDAARGRKQVFLARDPLPDWAFDTVTRYHPAPHRLGTYVRRLMARNALQVLGRDGHTPVAHVVCWTPGGTGRGGTGQALRIAADHGIPIHDLARPAVFDCFYTKIWR